MAHRRLVSSLAFVLGIVLAKRCNCFVTTAGTSRFGRLPRRDDGGACSRPRAADPPVSSLFRGCSTTALRIDKFNRDINEKSIEKAASGGGGSVAAGAILGGLVGGPFGALFGAAVGGNIGTKNAFDKARKEEMEKKGITQEMLDAAEEVGYALEQSMIGMDATRESLRSQQTLARRIEEDMNNTYEKAKAAMVEGREEDARSFLLKRNGDQDRLKDVLKNCAEEKKRIGVMESNVSALKTRAMEVEAILQRAVGAKARRDSSDLVAEQSVMTDLDLSLSREDPLLKKFKDAGIE